MRVTVRLNTKKFKDRERTKRSQEIAAVDYEVVNVVSLFFFLMETFQIHLFLSENH